MSTWIRGIVGAAAVVLGVVTAAAAQSQPLRGIVRDHTGAPMAGAVVTIAHPQETAVRVAVTDLQGRYRVDALEDGTRYSVRVSHPRFRKARLQAEPGDHVTVRLKPRRVMRKPPAPKH